MPSPVSSRLTLEFETAFSMEAEEPIRFSSTDILPYLSQPSRSCSSSSDFDTQSEAESRATSFCDFNDSNRITLGSLIGLPMDSFRHNFGESFRFRANSHYDTGSSQRSTTDSAGSPRRSRTCSLLFDLLRCLQRTRADYAHFKVPVARPNLNNLTSFTITEVSEEEERDSESDVGPTVFENSVFVERDTLGSRIYEFNPLYISDAISEADPTEVRDLSLRRDHSQESVASPPTDDNVKKHHVDTSDTVPSNVDSTRSLSNVQVTRTSSHMPSPKSPSISRISQPLSPMRTVLTTVCCKLGEFSDVEDMND